MNQRDRNEGKAPAPSPSQTIGPFFHDVVALTGSNDSASGVAVGEDIRIEGRVLDGAGDPVDDALVEIWQPQVAEAAHAEGANPQHSDDSGSAGAGDGPLSVAGFARSQTANEGRFSFRAIKPPLAADGASPFVLVRLFGRGLLRSLVTRIYFEDVAHGEDPLLQSIDPKRRGTLMAKRDESTDPPTYRFDIHLQGDLETVFLELRYPQP